MGMAREFAQSASAGAAQAVLSTATNANHRGTYKVRARASGVSASAGRLGSNRASRRNSVKPKAWYREFEKSRGRQYSFAKMK